MQFLDVLGNDLRDDDDGNAEQNSREMNIAAEFMPAILPIIHVVTKVPTRVAMARESPATSNALESESNCMNAAIPVTAAVTPGPR